MLEMNNDNAAVRKDVLAGEKKTMYEGFEQPNGPIEWSVHQIERVMAERTEFLSHWHVWISALEQTDCIERKASTASKKDHCSPRWNISNRLKCSKNVGVCVWPADEELKGLDEGEIIEQKKTNNTLFKRLCCVHYFLDENMVLAILLPYHTKWLQWSSIVLTFTHTHKTQPTHTHNFIKRAQTASTAVLCLFYFCAPCNTYTERQSQSHVPDSIRTLVFPTERNGASVHACVCVWLCVLLLYCQPCAICPVKHNKWTLSILQIVTFHLIFKG